MGPDENLAVNEAVLLHLAQLLDEHFLVYGRNQSLSSDSRWGIEQGVIWWLVPSGLPATRHR